MFIEDGSTEQYLGAPPKGFTQYSWGWVGDEIISEDVWKDEKEKEAFLKALASLEVVRLCRGFHVCEICNKSSSNGERVFESNGYSFAAPAGVDHYIVSHGYCPPREVIDALLSK